MLAHEEKRMPGHSGDAVREELLRRPLGLFDSSPQQHSLICTLNPQIAVSESPIRVVFTSSSNAVAPDPRYACPVGVALSLSRVCAQPQ